MVELRARGYTFEAIRQALAAAGIHVSNSTVQREVARAAKHLSTGAPATTRDFIRARSIPSSLPSASIALAGNASTVNSGPSDCSSSSDGASAIALPKGGEARESRSRPPPPGQSDQSSFANGLRGEDVAKTFMATHVTNPFMLKKEHQ